MTVALVDSGGANLNSVIQALKRLKVSCEVTCDAKKISQASHVIIPGVACTGQVMKKLREKHLVECLIHLKQPTLGICLGMQLLYDFSDEDETACLGLISGTVQKFDSQKGRAVPHMGWNRVWKKSSNEAHPLLIDIPDGSYFYFVHSYFAGCYDAVVAEANYGERVSAVVQKNNFFGVQFHPEKSSGVGAQLLRNFLQL